MATVNPIQALIAERGPIPFRDFMELALYHPLHGYYGSGRASLGREGDYFTSVSVGPLFGQLLAWQFREMWESLGCPGVFTLVEQGANDGAFAEDALTWIRANAPEFFEAVRYEIVEPIESLRARQRERLARHADRLRWHESLATLPPFTGVHFSNELIDAFPVHLIRFEGGGWRERYVTAELAWTEQEIQSPVLLAKLADVPRLEGYTTEVNFDALDWAAELASKLRQGFILAIDYGFPRTLYYSPDRPQGTLKCIAGHARQENPLGDPGYCDLTAHVDFTSLADAFLTSGMQLSGYTDQHHFLTGLAAKFFAERPPSARETRELKTLLHPEMLGTSFKVLGLSRNNSLSLLSGFRFARDPHRELGL